MESKQETIERWKTEYPGKWREAQRLAQESFSLVPGSSGFNEKAEKLFIELGGGCVENLFERFKALQELFAAVQKDMRDEVKEALGYDQMCSGSHAVRRMVQRFKEIEAAGRRILAEPFGCPFCDSGKLRNPAKNHLEDCGFAMMTKALPPLKQKQNVT